MSATDAVVLPPWVDAFYLQLEELAKLPAIRPVAGGVVVNRRGELLMVHSNYANQGWHFPKGGVNEGQDSLAGGVAEVEEEAGVEVVAQSYFSASMPVGQEFPEKLAFAAPRYEPAEPYNLECLYFGRRVRVRSPQSHHDGIALGTAWLLEKAANRASLAPEEFIQWRDQLLHERRAMTISWRNHAEYHVMAYRQEAPHLLSGESTEIRWWTRDEILWYLQTKNNLFGKAVGWVMTQETFLEAIEKARQAAE
jgi:8-oxo-dGTP pyrophosphatase MutT (NUDIX family)